MRLQGVGNLAEDDLIYIKTASLPGRDIGNVKVPYMGLDLNVPGSVTYPGSDSYAIQFYLDAKSELRDYFEQASRALFNDATSTGEYGTPDENSYIVLAQLDKDLSKVAEYELHGASLRTIGNISYDIAGGTGATVAIDATIAYHFYTATQLQRNDSGAGGSQLPKRSGSRLA